MNMKSFFFVSDIIENLLFKNFDVKGNAAVIAACVSLGFLTFVLEGAKALMVYWIIRIKQHPLTYGHTDGHFQTQNDESPLFSSLMIPATLDQIKYRRIRYHIFGALTHIFNVTLGYFIMLAVMKYNVWLLIAVLLGSGIGHYVFGAYTQALQKKYSNLIVGTNEDAGKINNATQDESF